MTDVATEAVSIETPSAAEPSHDADILTEQMHAALARGDKAEAERLNRAVMGIPAPGSDGGEAMVSEFNAPSVDVAREGVKHMAALDEGIVDVLTMEDLGGNALGDDADAIAVAEDYASRLQSRMGEDWDAAAEPPAVEPMAVHGATAVMRATPEGQQLMRDLGGGEHFERAVGYMQAALSHITNHRPNLIGKLMQVDPDNPSRFLADRPAVLRAAVQYGMLVTHGKRAQTTRGSAPSRPKEPPRWRPIPAATMSR